MKYSSALLFVTGMLFSMHGADSSAQIRMKDNFLDGDYTNGTIWKPGNSKEPWLVTKSSIHPSGKMIFDSISTGDFPVIENGIFNLEFKVKFNSANMNGNNRFSVLLRDSTNRHAGYSVSIAQGTSNNSNLIRIDSNGKQKELARLKAPDACRFSTEEFAAVRFCRTAEGVVQLWVDGKLRMEATDSEFKRFDRIQFTCRCAAPDEFQFFTSIHLR